MGVKKCYYFSMSTEIVKKWMEQKVVPLMKAEK
jgi:hypothetical protein